MKKTKERIAAEKEYLRNKYPDIDIFTTKSRNDPLINITLSDIFEFFSEKVIRRINSFLIFCCFFNFYNNYNNILLI